MTDIFEILVLLAVLVLRVKPCRLWNQNVLFRCTDRCYYFLWIRFLSFIFSIQHLLILQIMSSIWFHIFIHIFFYFQVSTSLLTTTSNKTIIYHFWVSLCHKNQYCLQKCSIPHWSAGSNLRFIYRTCHFINFMLQTST